MKYFFCLYIYLYVQQLTSQVIIANSINFWEIWKYLLRSFFQMNML